MSRSLRPAALLAFVILASGAACSSKDSTPPDDSDTDIQAVGSTDDVKYIDITVTRLSDHALVYYSGILPSSNYQNMRQALEEHVTLQASTDFLFDANAYDTNKVLLASALTVQKATQPAGVPTTVLIVIDLGGGGTDSSNVDITAVTDNIPVLSPPSLSTLPSAGGQVTLTYLATDADWPTIDPSETMTFFSAVLSGNATPMSGSLFTLGQSYTVTLNDDQPVEILCVVVDRFDQANYLIMEMDPSSGEFHLAEQGDGFAVISPLSTRTLANAAAASPPPITGQVDVVILQREEVSEIQAIVRASLASQVTPDDVAIWEEGTVKSFNIYEEQPGQTPPVDHKIRVAVPGGATIDTLKFYPGPLVTFNADAQEGTSLANPTITSQSPGGSLTAGTPASITGTNFTGLSTLYLESSGGTFYPLSPGGETGTSVSTVIPAGVPAGTYTLQLFTYGRIALASPYSVTISD